MKVTGEASPFTTEGLESISHELDSLMGYAHIPKTPAQLAGLVDPINYPHPPSSKNTESTDDTSANSSPSLNIKPPSSKKKPNAKEIPSSTFSI